MHLEGSCHCGRVRFTLESSHPYPFNRCYCSICRKTAGAGGFAINIGGEAESLTVTGSDSITVYQAAIRDDDGKKTGESPLQRHFCKHCGSQLYAWDSRWPDLIHPHASAIDTPLPEPPEVTHLMVGSKPAWVRLDLGPDDRQFDDYPDESLADWHRRLGLEC